MTFRDHNITIVEDDFGNKRELECNERYYVPSEIAWLLKTLGFKNIDIYGAKLGAFSRNDKLTTEDLVYKIVKALYEHQEEKDAIMPAAKDFNLENVFRGTENLGLPFHPGAIKYYKEKGIWK